MIASSMNKDDIAKSLSLTHDTIHAYTFRILNKLNVNTEAEAIRIAKESGFMDTGG